MDLVTALHDLTGPALVFAVVLLVQLGAPMPAWPVLMLSAAAAPAGGAGVANLLGAAVAGSLIADIAWYLAGRRWGRSLLGLLCRISLSPDGCVRTTESTYRRWGASALLVAKFVPGFASVATVLAGAMRIGAPSFLLFDGLGAMLWAGTGLALGVIFSGAIDRALYALVDVGLWGAAAAFGLLVLWVGVKAVRRQRQDRRLDKAPRITPQALQQMLDTRRPVLVLDARGPLADDEPRLPGALGAHEPAAARALAAHPADAPIVTYCACPQDAGAVEAAQGLRRLGHRHVHTLTGGIDGWRAAGGAFDAGDHRAQEPDDGASNGSASDDDLAPGDGPAAAPCAA